MGLGTAGGSTGATGGSTLGEVFEVGRGSVEAEVEAVGLDGIVVEDR
jgi:hypothetical protein